jgi:Na+-driven multidrug efflux pump
LAEPIARAMIADPEVVRLTVRFIYILAAAQPLMAVDFALGGSLRGAGDTRSPLLATFAGLILGRVLLASICIGIGLDTEWAYATLLADYVLKAAVLVTRFRSGAWVHAIDPSTQLPAKPKPAVA